MAQRKKRVNGGAFMHIVAIVAIVVILIVAALFLAFTTDNNKLDQSGSPNTTDNNGANPSTNNSTLLSGQASAQVIVTIHSTHLIFDVQYHLFLNTDQMAEGDIAAHSSVIHTITLVFPENQTGLYKAVILATSNGGGFGDKSDQVIVDPVNGGTYPVTLNI
jgi:uncharacterized membrane protein YjgN (DUF898 family)